MDVKIRIWWDTQDRNNQGWACHLSRDEGYGFESDFSDSVDAEKDASLQELIDEALTGVRNVPTAAMAARNWRRDPDGYEFRGLL
ncbi:MAG: hypothetical protein OEV08_13080 [Nitrospira sp.]|nr:hypothetical protein [Nitrospira sp.]